MTNTNFQHRCNTNKIDSVVKSCLNCDDPHLHFIANLYLNRQNILFFPLVLIFVH